MTMAEIRASAVIFSLLFIIIGISGIVLAFSPYLDWPVRLFLGFTGIAIVVAIVIGMKKIKQS